MDELFLSVHPKRISYAHMRQGKLRDLIVESKKSYQLTGNVYRGQVRNIIESMQSAFVDISEEEHGFIHTSDILENRQKLRELYEIDYGDEEEENADIGSLLQIGQAVLVQATKEPLGSKGARLSAKISLSGRYLILLPNTPRRGVSRKIEDLERRKKLKEFAEQLDLPKEVGLICRTSSSAASLEALLEEAQELFQTWQGIIKAFSEMDKPTLLYQESTLIEKTIRILLDKPFDRFMTDDSSTYQLCRKVVGKERKEKEGNIEFYRDRTSMFEKMQIDREIDKALQRKVWLPSGGYLLFERTEAMYTIDVNSGKGAVGKELGLEESIVYINLEATKEIARQLRLRNIGGLIICDFIDMQMLRNQKRVLAQLKMAMKEDDAKCTILGMSRFGLVEMTRQRTREPLSGVMLEECPYCCGSGSVSNAERVSMEIEQKMRKLILQKEQFALQLVCHPQVDDYLEMEGKEHLRGVAEELNGQIQFAVSDRLHVSEFEFYSTLSEEKLELGD